MKHHVARENNNKAHHAAGGSRKQARKARAHNRKPKTASEHHWDLDAGGSVNDFAEGGLLEAPAPEEIGGPGGDRIGDYRKGAIDFGGVALDPEVYNKATTATGWRNGSYWYSKAKERLYIHTDANTQFRLADPNERNQLIAGILANEPKNAATIILGVDVLTKDAQDESTLIPQRIYYSIEYTQKPAKSDPSILEVKVTHLQEQDNPKEPIDLTQIDGITKSAIPEVLNLLESSRYDLSFPQKTAGAYFKVEPHIKALIASEIQSSLDHWKTSKAASFQFDQTFKVRESGGNIVEIRATAFFSQSTAGLNSINTMYLPATAIAASPDIIDKDFPDYDLEKFYAKTPSETRRFGKLRGLDQIPELERMIVKKVAIDMFKQGWRDSEVDQIIPIKDPNDPNKVLEIYYTYHIHPEDPAHVVDFTVTRLGVEGKDFPDPDVATISGAFDFRADFTVEELKAWIQGRYPSIYPSIAGIAEKAQVLSVANQTARSSMATPDWFKTNYNVKVLTGKEADSFLSQLSDFPAGNRAGLKDFTPTELEMLELSLQRMPKPILKLLEGAQLIRQAQIVDPKKREMEGAGLSIQAKKTSLLDDDAFASLLVRHDYAFMGDADRKSPKETGTPTHELGHLLGYSASVTMPGKSLQANYNSFCDSVHKEFGYQVVGVTQYARSVNPGVHEPATEAFPEIFKLFVHDPSWVLRNRPVEHIWLTELATTGKDPSYTSLRPKIKAFLDETNN